jgi:uncharacterized protein (DUF302 family)
MKYAFNKTISGTFQEVTDKVTQEPEEQGFGILTEIEATKTLKKKLDIDIKKYKMSRVCNPSFAHKAIQSEDKMGMMLPNNVIVHEIKEGVIEVAAPNPIASKQPVENEKLLDIAKEITSMLETAIENYKLVLTLLPIYCNQIKKEYLIVTVNS